MAFSLFKRNKQDKVITDQDNQQVKQTQTNYDYNLAALQQIIDASSILNRKNDELMANNGNFDNVNINLSFADNNTDKNARNRVNWQIALSPEVAWCIDELLSELYDIEFNINVADLNLDDKLRYIVDNEFHRFINLFDFNDLQFAEDIKHFIVEGELAYETIISNEHPEFGIIGIRRLYSDVFKAVQSPILNNGFVLNIDVPSLFNRVGPINANTWSSSGSASSKLMLNRETNEYETDNQHIALTFPSVAYIQYDKNYLTGQTVSLIDKARQAFFQLSTMQKAAIVMRITRSPERLLFNVDVGGMSDKVAGDFLRKFGNSLKSKKSATPDGDITSEYNPSTMLESYIFGKSDANGGTTVQTVTSTANFDQLGDIQYFQNRLLNIFKIPFSRLTEPNKTYQPASQLNYDECRFYRFIQYIEKKFSDVITKLFIFDLQQRGININTDELKIEIEPPERYSLFLESESIKAKFDLYSTFADREEFNQELLMSKYLNMSQSEIDAHKKAQAKKALADEKIDDMDSHGGDLRDFDIGGGHDDFGGGSDMPDLGGDDVGGGDEDLGGDDNEPSEPEPSEPPNEG